MNTCKTEYDFTLVLSGIDDFTDDQAEALFNAGCDDATLARRRGRVYLTFSREAESKLHAMLSAIADVEKANIEAVVERIDDCDLVTQAEIARRLDRSRQIIGMYISGERGPGGFPAPACNIIDGQPLWYWCSVAFWASSNNLIRAEETEDAAETSMVNAMLDLKRLRIMAPGALDEIRRYWPDLDGLPLGSARP